LPKPVLSVGNLTFGGTGKTPFVIHAAAELIRRVLRPGILSRGYKALPGESSDEARVIARHLPEVPHILNPDRHAAGLELQRGVDCFVLDDGFQHLPLARDADCVLIDATDPFAGGRCPPAGRLREPLSALGRADLVVLTRADLVERETVGAIMREVRAHTAAPVATSRFVPEYDADLNERKVLAACGIGNPRAFSATLRQLGARVVEERFFRDHHVYTPRDVEELAAEGLPVAVTEKDAVKLKPLWPDSIPLHVVRIRFAALDGAAEIDALFDRIAHACGGEELDRA